METRSTKHRETIVRMLLLSQAFLYSLTDEQRRACEYPMDHPGRLDWDFIPKIGPHRHPDRRSSTSTSARSCRHCCARASACADTRRLSRSWRWRTSSASSRSTAFGVSTGDFRSQDLYFVSVLRPAELRGHVGMAVPRPSPLAQLHDRRSALAVGHAVQHGRAARRDGRAQPASCRRGPRLRDPPRPAATRSASKRSSTTSRRPTTRPGRCPASARSSIPTTSISASAGTRSTTKTARRSKFEKDNPRGVAGSDMPADQARALVDLVESFVGGLPDEVSEKLHGAASRPTVSTSSGSAGPADRSGHAALLPHPGRRPAHRVRQRDRQRQPHPLGVA